MSMKRTLAILSSREGLRLTFETALDAAILMNSEGAVADWNDRATDAFGWSRGEAVGQTLADLIIPKRYREAHVNGLRQYLATGKRRFLGRRFEVWGLKKNGEEFPVELSISAIQDGDSVLFVGFLRDLSERIELRRARDELARVTQMIATTEIAASIAHEINQPLAAIATAGSAGLRWLERATPDLDEVRLALKSIINNSHHASDVIAGIRSMFRKDNQERAPQDLNELIREVLTLVRVEVEEQRVSLFTELYNVLPVIQANRLQLRQVIVNLVKNAVDAMSTVEGRPRILRIKTETHGLDYVLIKIEDSGIGIDPRNIDRIFNAFFTTKPHGMGMGLSICRSIIEDHGGRLSVVAGRPHGSIFHLSLPINAIELHS